MDGASPTSPMRVLFSSVGRTFPRGVVLTSECRYRVERLEQSYDQHSIPRLRAWHERPAFALDNEQQQHGIPPATAKDSYLPITPVESRRPGRHKFQA